MVHTSKKGKKGIRLTAKEADARSRANAAAAKAKGKKVVTRPTQVLKKPIKVGKSRRATVFEASKKVLGRTRLGPGVTADVPVSTKLSVASGLIPAGAALRGAKAVKSTIGFTKGVPKTAQIARSRGLSVVDELAQVGKSGKVEDLTKTFIDVNKIGRVGKLSKAQTRSLAKEVAVRRIRQTADRAVANRFAVNAKSQGLTKSLLAKAGLTLGAAGILVGAIGSYPFAGFIKEEAIQTLGFAFNTAERNGDIEGMELALSDVEEILNAESTVLNKVPYANVLVSLKSFFRAAETKLEVDSRRLETIRGEQEAGETAFQAEQAEGRQTQLEQRERDSEYFALIREGKFEEAEELLQSELKGGN